MQRIPDKQHPCLDSSAGDDANDDAGESYRPWAGWKPLQPALQRIQTNDYFVWIQSWVDEDSSGKATYMRQLIPSFAATANAKTKWSPTSFVSFWNVDNVVFLASCRMHERLLVTMMMMTLCFGDDIVSLVMMRMMMLIVMLLLLLLRMLTIMMMLCLLPMGPGWRGIQTKDFNVWVRLWAMVRLMMLTTPCVLLLRWGREGIQTKDFDVWFRLWARMLLMMPPSSFIVAFHSFFLPQLSFTPLAPKFSRRCWKSLNWSDEANTSDASERYMDFIWFHFFGWNNTASRQPPAMLKAPNRPCWRTWQ